MQTFTTNQQDDRNDYYYIIEEKKLCFIVLPHTRSKSAHASICNKFRDT